jgi:hypothetical protein
LGGWFVEHVVSTVFVNWLIKLSRLAGEVASGISEKIRPKTERRASLRAVCMGFVSRR